ncbi:SDR family oxidoreductase [Hoeflea sp. G2-23]|uniref:SDR family oxidoreductase n=1 Tax=Hoeflea algicola TaxID=2983763 RepID=A0ABT3ZC95_9HYPH|nr:SDR family oxidoreductase [Hoeflea algicola]MCY0149268.1 SDR family oxidoreductase [Hoeflea algicola]
MDLGLKQKRVLITGASQGIGAGLAEAFAEEGADLHLVARSAERLGELANRLGGDHGVNVRVQALDLTASGSVAEVVANAGDVDILVNNAGAIPGGDLWKVDAENWRAGWELKVFGYIDLCREIYPLMKARGSGVILNNIGNGGENPDFDYIAGSTGNAALMALTRALGGRSLDDGIRVLGINPGPVATDRINNMLKTRAAARLGDAERYAEYLLSYPLGRAATVREVADLFVYLASHRSGYSSGAIFTVDGGITSRRSI